MKIKVKEMRYEDVLAKPIGLHRLPHRPGILFRTLLKLLSWPDLRATHFSCKRIGMEKLGKKEPCLILMNHSSFIDLKIAATVLYPRAFNIVCTSDGFVGKNWLMRAIGCIPTSKFVTDMVLVRDMMFAVKKQKSSVLMFPEASYSFDGTATPLPESLGKCLKILGVPVVMIRTYGAFSRDPLYNNLKLRKVDVSADMEYLLSPEEIAQKSVTELNKILTEQFSFDNFRWQQENRIRIAEAFRADSLNRVLYKCPHCGTEGKMLGKGTSLICGYCGKGYELDEYGYLRTLGNGGAESVPDADGGGKPTENIGNDNGSDADAACGAMENVETEEKSGMEFTHIPDWYRWERECVKKELEDGTYCLDVAVDICMMVDTKGVYRVGSGRLRHNVEGFQLTGCDGKLNYSQKPSASYSLYADYYWYEIGDMICIGNTDVLYYCFPKEGGDVVAKTRLAAEELHKMTRKGGREKTAAKES
ncbi:MAG: 1-acyl-sn-glycerol-3-phosphate acyltransferase [bacterium]|nr:1-acyl-sn-glycerol-3-phosphate acyltransferase [bacterium]